MGMQVKSSPQGLGGPHSPKKKPTESPGRSNGKKLDFSTSLDENGTSTQGASNNRKAFSPFFPLAHVLDVRSLALFRILFGLLQLSDIYGRLSAGKYDLAWYTSVPEERSYYYPNQPSQQFPGPLGQLFLFQRTTIPQEIGFFLVYGILLIMLTIGYQCQNCWLLPMIWLFTNGLICKGDAGSWGSDMLAQQLVIWIMFLPLSEAWSVDAWIRRKRGLKSNYPNHQVKSVACLGILLHINIMYLNCTLERTIHTYKWNEVFDKSDWLNGELVWYAANGSGTYNTWFTRIVRETQWLSQFMTYSGFLIELTMPILCFIFNQRYSHWFALNLLALHFGIGLIIAIPHFAAMGCLIHTLWIPTHVWDRLLGSNNDDKSKSNNTVPKQSALKRSVSFVIRATSTLLQCVMLFLLLCSFLETNGWFLEYTKKPTDFAWNYFLMTNEWGMWSPGAEKISPYTVILGGRKRQDGEDEDEYDVYNLFHFLKTGGEEVPFEGFSEEFLADSTYLYPSTRWEKALGDDWGDYLSSFENDISDNILRAWCEFINEDLEKLGRPPMDAIEIRIYLRPIGTPASGKRYSPEAAAQEGSVLRYCFEDNEPAEYYDEYEGEYYDDEYGEEDEEYETSRYADEL